MPARLKFAMRRVVADFEPAGYPPISVGESSDGPVVLWELPHASVRFLVSDAQDAEVTADYVALTLQGFVTDDRQDHWPQINGRPLFPSADSGVACWCLDGKPWCAVGQLAQALAAHEEADDDDPAV
jgi:hypothetical protein